MVEKILANEEIMSEERLLSSILLNFTAGSETTSTSITFCLWELCQPQNQALYEELVQEALALDNLLDATISYQDVMQRLPKTLALFYEINRWGGSTPSLLLTTRETVTVADHEFPPDTSFHMHLAYLGTQPGSNIPNGPRGESPAIFAHTVG